MEKRIGNTQMVYMGNFVQKTEINELINFFLSLQPTGKSDGWNTEPFELKEINGVMYGRGS